MSTRIPAILAKAADPTFWAVQDAQMAETLISGSFCGLPGSPLYRAHAQAYERHAARQQGRKALKRVLARQAAEAVPVANSDEEARRTLAERGNAALAGRPVFKASGGTDPLLQVDSAGLYQGPAVGPRAGGIANIV